VNMFVIPAGMLLGADISFGDWWGWNTGPVLIGNFLGAVLFTALPLYFSHRTKINRAAALPADDETASAPELLATHS